MGPQKPSEEAKKQGKTGGKQADGLLQGKSEIVIPMGDTPRTISQLQFTLYSAEAQRRMAHVQVVFQELYKSTGAQGTVRVPHANGPLDPKLGLCVKRGVCVTCGLPLQECVGHWGYITLALPVFHVGYFNATLAICRMICKCCSKVLLAGDRRRTVLDQMRGLKEPSKKELLSKALVEECRKITRCFHCGSYNGNVRKIPGLKMVHDKFATQNQAVWQPHLNTATHFNPNVQKYVSNNIVVGEDLTPLRALQLFERISPEDIELLNMDPTVCHPKELIMTQQVVPPVCIRPSVPSSFSIGSTSEDDLTMKLLEIIHMNNLLKGDIDRGAPLAKIMDEWDSLQLHVASFIDSGLPGFPPKVRDNGKKAAGRHLVQRLKGKQGRFRGNLSGKRVDFTARTVISPDPNIEVTEVVVPVKVAKVLTYPEKVTVHNFQNLKKAILNGPDIHPGALYVYKENGKFQQSIKYGDKRKIATMLKTGDIVERHLRNGDLVLFNRQPSLHKLSIMCMRAKVLPYRTLRFNECACTPFNADFDGDEMNLHLPQTEEARAEALVCMAVNRNLITPRNGEIIIAATQDFLTAAFLMTSKDRFFDRTAMSQILSYMNLFSDEDIQFPPPAIWKPAELWSGKQVFAFMVNPYGSNPKKRYSINIECKTRVYAGAKKPETFCPNDGYVMYRDSYHVSGRLTKGVLGGGAKDGLFFALHVAVSAEYSAMCMARISRLTSRWLTNFGMSIGISDVTPSRDLEQRKQEELRKGYVECDDFIRKYTNKQLDLIPGLTLEQTLEAELNRVLSEIRNSTGEQCIKELPKENSPLIMTLCGSKGSTINISQMVCCVGQQTINSKRIGNGFVDRSLPHFERNSRDPPSRGFVGGSFLTGITATEFFFHTMGGREGLVDTAVKTAETGYMQRRLMKALEDLSIQYDNTVRNSEMAVIQFRYGDDGLDPVQMEADNGKPINLPFQWTASTLLPVGKDMPLFYGDISPLVQNHFAQHWANSSLSVVLQQDIAEFFEGIAAKAKSIAESFGLPSERAAFYDWCGSPRHKKLLLFYTHASGCTERRVLKFLTECRTKNIKYTAEAGTACGALGGQSIGEPATQMTLKTFHFAGVASMNITQGVPRIKEIINANKTISTPVITATLENKTSLTSIRIVKGRIERTTLGEICSHIEEVYTPNLSYIFIKLDAKVIIDLHLEITAQSVRRSIVHSEKPKLKLQENQIEITTPTTLQIIVSERNAEKAYVAMKWLQLELPYVVVAGIPSVQRVLIEDTGNKNYQLLIEGQQVEKVLCVPGVVGHKTTINHIIVAQNVFGIEAARTTIINEITKTMKSHSLSIDVRHVQQLADVMTFKGQILGIQRFGIKKMRDSALMLASFERTTDVLFDAAVRGKRDPGLGVSECIIMGTSIPVGTGMPKLLMRAERRGTLKRRDPWLSGIRL